ARGGQRGRQREVGPLACRVPTLSVTSVLARGRGEPRKAGGGVHQGDVAEGLWEIAHQPPGSRIVLLAGEAHVVPEREQPLEERPRLLLPVDHGECIHEPEAAGEERALAGWEPPPPFLAPVPHAHPLPPPPPSLRLP